MEARKYTKRIEVYKCTAVPDGFGGNLETETLVYTMWANVKTKNAYVNNENGQTDNFVLTIFTVRNRVDLHINPKENFIYYNNLIYNVTGVLNKDLDNIDIEIQATQRV